MNNNKMGRMNGEVRDREKVLRGLKKDDPAILLGYQLFHSYVKLHGSLDGKTLAEACGIKVEGQNKWKTLIENASKERLGSFISSCALSMKSSGECEQDRARYSQGRRKEGANLRSGHDLLYHVG
jgi:hypothetical protein